MKKKDYDTLIWDWENTTQDWKSDWKTEITKEKF
jgi:hypothetical protein